MNLQTIEALEWSAVVANNTMNRDRISTGINSYEREIKIDPIKFIEERVHQNNIQWTDLCCGSGRALIQAANQFKDTQLESKISLIGIDLVNYFATYERKEYLELKQQNLNYWNPQSNNDLITIVHGLHYVGDKLDLIIKAAAALKENGYLLANLDLNNIQILNESKSKAVISNYFKAVGLQYNARTKILRADGHIKMANKFKYLGADDQAGPNYTGQGAVNSFYEFLV